MTNEGTETAFRHDHCKHFQKSKHLLGSKVSRCYHQLASCTDPKRSIPRGQSSRTGMTQVDFEVDRPPPADSPPGDFLITMVNETVIILIPKTIGNRKRDCAWGCAGVKKLKKINCWAQIIKTHICFAWWWFVLNNWFFFNFLTPAHPHAQSLFLFPIVFGINLIKFFDLSLRWPRRERERREVWRGKR